MDQVISDRCLRARTSQTEAGLLSEPFGQVAEASEALNTEICIEGSENVDACPVGLFDALGGQPAGIRPFLELEADAIAGAFGPATVQSWRVDYTCIPST